MESKERITNDETRILWNYDLSTISYIRSFRHNHVRTYFVYWVFCVTDKERILRVEWRNSHTWSTKKTM